MRYLHVFCVRINLRTLQCTIAPFQFQRHRIVNQILQEQLKTGVHALSINAHTVEQWQTCNKATEPSPKCRGGFGK